MSTINKKIICTLLPVIMALPFSSSAQNKHLFESGSYVFKSETLPFRILYPLKFDPAKKYPLIVVLHGAGERGNNNEDQLKYGTELFLNDTIRQKYGAIVIYPQCPADGYWSNVKIESDVFTGKQKFVFQYDKPETQAMADLIGLVNKFLDKPYVNKHKVYVGGLSMGGMGTFEIIWRMPNVFAAAFAMSAGDNTLNAKKYAKKVPLWIFHGEKDSVVSYSHSESIVAAIKEAGGNPRYTLYPKDDHNCWDDAFKEPDLMPWLFSHSR